MPQTKARITNYMAEEDVENARRNILRECEAPDDHLYMD
jgi:hypothetical protein